MRTLIEAGAIATPEEGKSIFDYSQERRSAEFILFPINDYLDKVTVSDEDLNAWYEAHKAEYTIPHKMFLRIFVYHS